MQELQSDHNEEFDVWIVRLMPGVKGIVHKLQTRSCVMDGDDLTQAALIHLWTLFSQGSARDKTESYLLQGCYHHLRNQLRLKRHTSMECSLDEDAPHLEPDPYEERSIRDPHSLEDAFHGEWLLRSVHESGLTQREKTVLSQLLDGSTVREIGSHLGVSHVQVVKIKKSIRSKLPKAEALYL